jgi:hypothetical protein
MHMKVRKTLSHISTLQGRALGKQEITCKTPDRTVGALQVILMVTRIMAMTVTTMTELEITLEYIGIAISGSTPRTIADDSPAPKHTTKKAEAHYIRKSLSCTLGCWQLSRPRCRHWKPLRKSTSQVWQLAVSKELPVDIWDATWLGLCFLSRAKPSGPVLTK